MSEALNEALARLTPLQTDARLDSASQALVGELIQADQLALGALRADDTIPAGQRNARAQQISDKVKALNQVESSHKATIGVDELYNAMDLSMDAAMRGIIFGLPTFVSNIDVG